jgi:hypothetical protein
MRKDDFDAAAAGAVLLSAEARKDWVQARRLVAGAYCHYRRWGWVRRVLEVGPAPGATLCAFLVAPRVTPGLDTAGSYGLNR